MPETGMLTVYAGTRGAEISALTDLTADELARAARDLSEVEIARARTQTKAGLVMGLESPAARAERMAGTLSIWGKILPLEETVAKIDAVDVDRARAVLKRIIAETPALALYGPVERAPDATALAQRLAA